MIARFRSPAVLACNGAFLLISALGLVFCMTAARAAEDHRFEPMDKINLRIVEWQPEAGEFRDWSGVDGVYTVSPSGKLSLPFVGSVEAAGKTATFLSKYLESEFAKKLGIVNQLTASIEIAEFRPILMGGDVQTPGSYPYKPGMTVRQALILAGGYPRDSKGGGDLFGSFVNARTDFDVLTKQRQRLEATRARLQAQRHGKNELKMPPSLAGQPDARQVVNGEQEILQAEQRQQQLQLRSLKDLKDLLGNELVSLGKKDAAQQEELMLLQQELSKVDTLKEKGFATNSNVLVLKQQIADLKSRLLDVDLARMTAEQNISKASQDEIKIKNESDAKIAKDLNDTRDELRQTEIKLASDRDLMTNAMIQSVSSLRSSMSSQDLSASFKIFRKIGADWTKVDATQDTALQPGDIVETKLAMPGLARGD